jgi:hypothetical protein
VINNCTGIMNLLMPENVADRKTLRKSGGFGDPGRTYSYNGAIRTAQSWQSWMIPLKSRLEKLIGEKFNFMLVNYFPNKEAGIGEHTDLGGGMKLNSKIACVSVGYTHVLRILMASTREVLQEIEIPSGAIYSMEGRFQEMELNLSRLPHQKKDECLVHRERK